jgi:hypothetical protein
MRALSTPGLKHMSGLQGFVPWAVHITVRCSKGSQFLLGCGSLHAADHGEAASRGLCHTRHPCTADPNPGLFAAGTADETDRCHGCTGVLGITWTCGMPRLPPPRVRVPKVQTGKLWNLSASLNHAGCVITTSGVFSLVRS